MSFVQVATPRVPFEQASRRTVQRRVNKMRETRGALSVELAEEVRALQTRAPFSSWSTT